MKKKRTPIKVKSRKPMTLSQLRRLAIKKNKSNSIQLTELDLIVAQEKNEGEKYKFIFDGSAMVDGSYVSDFLSAKRSQAKGEMVFLNGVSKRELDDYWSPETVQVCDGNILATDCMDGLFVYKN